MKRWLLLAWIACFPFSSAFSWGPTGHRACGLVAEQYLNAKAKKRLAKILGQESVAMAGTWMDDIRSDSTYNYAVDWHYTTVPDGKSYADVATNPEGKVVMMIEKLTADLKSGKLNTKQELESLKMLIHLIEDIHQPLHVGKSGDKGGNDVKVKWFRNDSNLHRVWDSDMIDDSKLSYTELANALARPDEITLAKWQKAPVTEWALESMSFRSQVYNIGNGNLGFAYTYKNFPIVRQRLVQAGIRLAAVLNDIYGR